MQRFSNQFEWQIVRQKDKTFDYLKGIQRNIQKIFKKNKWHRERDIDIENHTLSG